MKTSVRLTFVCLLVLAFAAPARTATAQAATQAGNDTARTDIPDPKVDAPPPGAREGTAIEGATTAWNPRWQPQTSVYDYVLTGVAIGVAVGASITPPKESNFRSGILFDDDARDTLRLKSLDMRYRIRDASDVGVSLLTTFPILVDSLIFAWWYRGNPEVARKIALMDAEAIALVAAVQGVTNTVVGRQRPYGGDCGGELPERSLDCEKQGRYRSFFSGHASQAFAGAGIICVNHLRMGLLGNVADPAICAGAIAVATATATFRMMGDMHYASDVILGALIGTTFGVGIPLLHGREVSDAFEGKPRLKLVPIGTGLGLGGSF